MKRNAVSVKINLKKIALEMRINGDCPEHSFTVMGNLIHISQIDSLEYFQDFLLFSLLFWNMREAFP